MSAGWAIAYCACHSDGFPVIGILFLGEAHERLSNTGVPHLLVDVISANNARYCPQTKGPAAAIFCTEPSKNWRQRALQFLKKALIIARRQQSLPPKIQKVRLEVHKISRIITVYYNGHICNFACDFISE